MRRSSSGSLARRSRSRYATRESASSTGADGATCAKSQIELTPVVDKPSYGPPEDPKIANTVNALIAAIVWVVGGNLLSKAVTRLAPRTKAS